MKLSDKAVQRWRRFDGESGAMMSFVHDAKGNLAKDADGNFHQVGTLDHEKAILENGKAIGETFLMTIPFTETAKWAKTGYKNGGVISAIQMGFAGLGLDAFMLIAGPLMMLKDVGDIAVHGAMLSAQGRFPMSGL